MYWLKVYEIPDVGAAGKGKHVGNLVALQPGETVRAILPVRDLEEENKYIFFVTRKGTVKKTPLKDFSNVMSRGIIAIDIDKEDELVGAQTHRRQRDYLPRIARGHGDPLPRRRRPLHGTPAFGVRGMDLDKGDYIVGMAVTAKEKPTRKQAENGSAVADRILSVTENAYGKRTDVDEYRLQSRGGKGVINVKTTSRNGKVVSIMLVTEDSEVMIISQYGKIIRTETEQIRAAGRSTQGVRLLHLEEGDRVAAAVVIPAEEAAANGDAPTLIQ